MALFELSEENQIRLRLFGAIIVLTALILPLAIRRPVLCFWFTIFFFGAGIWRGAEMVGDTYGLCMEPGDGYSVGCVGNMIGTIGFWGFFAGLGMVVGLVAEGWGASTEKRGTTAAKQSDASEAKGAS